MIVVPIEISMVDIPAGCCEFMMMPQQAVLPPEFGRVLRDKALPGQRAWTVSSFRLAARLITRGQWRAVMGTSPWHDLDEGPAPALDGTSASLPVTCVSYADAMSFCATASGEGRRLRLPTELEWEHACRGGSPFHLFSWGSSDALGEDVASAHAVFAPDRRVSKPILVPVGTRQANPFGLYDMVGLVKEYVLDRYHVNPISLRIEHGKIPAVASDFRFAEGDAVIMKGGAFDASLSNCCYLGRMWAAIGDMSHAGGFRVVEESG